MGKGILDTLFSVRVAVTTTSSNRCAVESEERIDCAKTGERKDNKIIIVYSILFCISNSCKCALDNFNYYHVNVKSKELLKREMKCVKSTTVEGYSIILFYK